eukprot:jgi/Botrbrau1/7378/Bobra.0316s0022.1
MGIHPYFALVAVLALVAGSSARPTMTGRNLLQSIDPPGNNRVLRQLHGVGTQNYSSGSDSKYQAAGAVADLYAPGPTKAGRHYFVGPGQPYFEVFDASGNVIGSVKGRVQTSAPVSSAPNDGGSGSVPQLLLTASDGTGVWQNVNFIQRVTTLGGVVPSVAFTLPAFQGVPNFELAIPYQVRGALVLRLCLKRFHSCSLGVCMHFHTCSLGVCMHFHMFHSRPFYTLCVTV